MRLDSASLENRIHSYPRAVVFDMDGLMLNTEDLYDLVSAQLLAKRGQTFTPDHKVAMMGRKAPDAMDILRTACELSESVEELIVETDVLMREILAVKDSLAQMPGLQSLLSLLEFKKIPKAIATSSSRVFAHGVLGRFDLIRRFEFVLCGDDVTHGKPHPEIYLKAAQRLGVPPAEMVVLEDSVLGSQAAVSAGAFAVAVPSQQRRPGDFDHVHMIVPSLDHRELIAVFG
jgi:beta-phosphoglucomutase-like phosphatase (HAD superfamily)